MPLLNWFKNAFRKLNKSGHNLIGLPYIWVDMRYLTKSRAVEINFDYNPAMLRKLAKANYDVSSPEDAVQQYISDCFHREGVTQEAMEPLFDDGDLPHQDERQ